MDRRMILCSSSAFAALGVTGFRQLRAANAAAQPPEQYAIVHTDAQWRKILSPAAYDVPA
jgi:hypothetical protein